MPQEPIIPPVSRRSMLRLSLGGYAATTAMTGAAWAAAPAAAGRKAPATAFADGLPRARPETQGIHPDAIMAFLDDVERGGFELHSFMLSRNGSVVAEGWWEPYAAERLHMTHSLTKSVTVCAVGLALAEGRFKLDDKVTSFFPEHLPAQISDNLAVMTVRDLLTMRTGHAAMTSGSVWRQIRTSWIAEFFKIPVVNPPGTQFVYTSAATYMLSAIITKTTGQSTADYLKPRLFDPMGISGYEWDVGPEGISPGANGLSWKTADSLKLGMLHAQKGMWNGRQLLPADWIEAVQQPYTPGRYGYQWWLGPNGIYFASGLFGQVSMVFPQHNAVLALTGAIPNNREFAEAVAYRHFPAAFGAAALPTSAKTTRLVERTRALHLLPPVRRPHSPVIARVSGTRYTFKDNAAKIRAVQLDFSGDECVFTQEDERGVHKIRVGLKMSIESNTSMTGNLLHHEYQLDQMRVVASGEWQDDRTLVMTWTFVESAFRDTVVCRFAGPHLRLDRSVNINSSATEMPTLAGRSAPVKT